MNIDDLVRICSDPETDASFLDPIIRGYTDRFKTLGSSAEVKVAHAITLNPSISLDQLKLMLMKPEIFPTNNLLNNPIFELVLLENPNFIAGSLHETAINNLLKTDFEKYYKLLLDSRWWLNVLSAKGAYKYSSEIFEYVKNNETRILKYLASFNTTPAILEEIYNLYSENEDILKQFVNQENAGSDLREKVQKKLYQMSPLGVAENPAATQEELHQVYRKCSDWGEDNRIAVAKLAAHSNCPVELYREIISDLLTFAADHDD